MGKFGDRQITVSQRSRRCGELRLRKQGCYEAVQTPCACWPFEYGTRRMEEGKGKGRESKHTHSRDHQRPHANQRQQTHPATAGQQAEHLHASIAMIQNRRGGESSAAGSLVLGVLTHRYNRNAHGVKLLWSPSCPKV